MQLLDGELPLAALTIAQMDDLEEDMALLNSREAPAKARRLAVARILAASASRVDPTITVDDIRNRIDTSNQAEAMGAAFGVSGLEKAEADRPT